MEPEGARIFAHSRQEAMDWGLVLASQGIEASIEGSEAEQWWAVAVAMEDYREALQAIRQYRLENRDWPWQLQLTRQGYLFDPGSLIWVLLVLLFYWVDSRTDLRGAGVMAANLVSQGQWWRLFTAVWLHADVGHLAANAALGFVLLGLAMGRYGAGVAPLAAYLAGVAGNLASWLLAAAPHRSLGASGMVLACVGLLGAQSIPPRRGAALPPRLILGGVFGGTMLFLLLGMGPGTDILAHTGGFLCGLLLGVGLALAPEPAGKGPLNLICGFVFGALVVIPWWLAFKPR